MTKKEYLTTEQLGEEMLRTVKQMNPVEKMQLRRLLNQSLLTKTAKRPTGSEDVVRDLPGSKRVN